MVFADCPDTIYRQFSVASGGVYRSTGTRGASPYNSFTAYRARVVGRVVSDLHERGNRQALRGAPTSTEGDERSGRRAGLDSQDTRHPDGTVKILVGPDDPGAGNWLDTKGRRETTLLARYLLPENELPPIVTRVIQI